jgi:hypothetical protein
MPLMLTRRGVTEGPRVLTKKSKTEVANLGMRRFVVEEYVFLIPE